MSEKPRIMLDTHRLNTRSFNNCVVPLGLFSVRLADGIMVALTIATAHKLRRSDTEYVMDSFVKPVFRTLGFLKL